MRRTSLLLLATIGWALMGVISVLGQDQPAVALPDGVKAVWDLSKATRQTTPTRQRICINGLWRWQPAKEKSDQPPTENWGYFKVPGPWSTTWNRAEQSQTHYMHPSWKGTDLRSVDSAWYQREIELPKEWAGRRILIDSQYVNGTAVIYIDGKRAGEIKPRGGNVDLTKLCQPGQKQVLSIFMNQRSNFRGLCGDVYLDAVPQAERIDDVKIDTSVRQWKISANTALSSLSPDKQYTLSGDILDGDKVVKTIKSQPFKTDALQAGRIAFSMPWKADKLWDTVTPQNKYDLKLKLLDPSGKVLDEFQTVRFGFREFWIDGHDFRLNGTKYYCFAAPLDVGEVSAYAASYEGARKMISRFKGAGINAAYTHNYGSAVGVHISFEEIMRAADDEGIVLSLAQPHFSRYKWTTPEADLNNGYLQDAEFYVRQAQNHPSVMMYATSHNSTIYNEDENPDQIDGIFNPYPDPEGKQMRFDKNGSFALRAEAMIQRLDPTRPIYHHASGHLGQAYTLNCYLNFAPMQDRSDWFEHWSLKGVKPLMLVEYGEPHQTTFTDTRAATHTVLHWFVTEWGGQFYGDASYQTAQTEKAASITRNSSTKPAVHAAYIARNWPAFRTWGVSMFNRWEIYTGWNARPDAKNGTCKTDWDNLQKPGYSPDFIRTQRWDLAYEDADWVPNPVGKALMRYNRLALAYIAGKSARFTSRDHNFTPGETVEKQAIVINNSRKKVACDCTWSLKLPKPLEGSAKLSMETGEQRRASITLPLPKDTKPGSYELTLTAKFDTGETQNDTFTIDVLPDPSKPTVTTKVAVFDPKGQTKTLLSQLGVQFTSIAADADTAGYDILVIGKHALTMADPKLNLARVRDGLKVVVFEQTNDVLEKRCGFRTQEYGLREVFPRIAGHAVFAGLTLENLHDWRGQGTTVPPRFEVSTDNPLKFPIVQWCGFEETRPWRVGCQGTVASVFIEKPAAGNFLPLVDGGFALQYSPLLEYREGSGMMLFCQLDVTGRTESDPAANRLVGNLMGYVAAWKSVPSCKLVYAGDAAGKAHLQNAKFAPADYQGGPLSADQVLVVGPGGGAKLAASAKDIEEWLKAGGRLLAVGLDQDEANAFLPAKVVTKKAEYICGNYTLPAADSPFVGIAPADIYNRSPRSLPLISEGAATLGDGVLGKAENVNVVFCQLVPWQFDYQKDNTLKHSFRRSSFTLTRLLSNLGAAADAPLLQNMQEPLPAIAMQDNVADVIWLAAGEKVLILPKVWKGQWVGKAEPPKGWETAGFDDSKWRSVKAPGMWQNQLKDLVNVNDVFLYRQTVDVPADMAQQDVTLVVGAVDDEDWTYVNGQLVGSTTAKTNPNNYWMAVRRYKLPAGLLKAGQNIIAVKNNDIKGSGGLLTSSLWRRGAGSTRWLSGLYLDKPEAPDDPYRYFRW